MASQATPRSMILLSMLVVPLVVWASLVTLLVPGVYGTGVNASILQQGMGQDAVTLFFAIPLTFVGLYLTFRGSIRGYLLLLGQLMYYAYTYLSATVLYPPNPMFPLHVAIFSASFFALARGLYALDVELLVRSMKERLPRKSVAIYLMLSGGMVGLLWIITYVVKLLTPGVDPNSVLGDQGPNLIIQALDLGLIVPLALVSGILLWRRHPWGYGLAGVMLVKASTMLLAIHAMMVVMGRSGQEIDLMQAGVFSLITLFGLVMLILYFSSIHQVEED